MAFFVCLFVCFVVFLHLSELCFLQNCGGNYVRFIRLNAVTPGRCYPFHDGTSCLRERVVESSAVTNRQLFLHEQRVQGGFSLPRIF